VAKRIQALAFIDVSRAGDQLLGKGQGNDRSIDESL
jgi:hypothetical protein